MKMRVQFVVLVALLFVAYAQSACDLSCKDANPAGCAQWKPQGFCENAMYKTFLVKNCRKSCNFCDEPIRCDPKCQKNSSENRSLKSCKRNCDVCKWLGWCAQGADHTMCKYKGIDKKQCTGIFARRKLSAAEKKEFLDAHNALRQKIAAGNQPGYPKATQPMPNLKWDNDLAKVAQKWMDQCVWAHDKNRVTKKFYTAVGQNLYMSSSTRKPTDKPWKKSVDAWYSEYADYFHYFGGDVSAKPTLPDGAMYNGKPAQIGHFTQVIWQETTHVGCGYIRFKKSNGYYTTYVGCNYGPAGNYNGQPIYQ